MTENKRFESKMNEKRFKYIAFDGFEDYGEFITPHQVVNLLNEYYEENMELKCKSKMIYERDAYKKLYEDLKEENEQLNQHIDEVEKDNERLEKITSQFKVGDIVNLKFANEVVDEQRKTIRKLSEENEQLKSELKYYKAIMHTDTSR